MATRNVYLAAFLGLAAAAGAAAFVLTRHHAPGVSTPVAPPGATTMAAPADCLLPGPPPVTPHGDIASTEEMKLGHDNLQHFVDQLEAYQVCRNAQIDHAAPTVTAQQKQEWLQQGNDAVDMANAIAARFSQQRQIFNAKNGIQ